MSCVSKTRVGVWMCGVLLVCAVSAWAAETPSATLQKNVDEVLMVLQEKDYRNPATRPPLRQKIETVIHTVFDFHEFSARTVGSNWPDFTPDQQKRFDEAFANLLLTTYLDKIDGYNGEKIQYNGENISQKGDRAEVQTVVTLSDGKPVPVAYRMMLKKDVWVVYDVLIENISLIKNYRSQFAEVLTRGTPDQLIERVQTRVNELRASAAK